MRLAILVAALLQVAAGPQPAAAQPAAAAPLGVDEVLLEVGVVGRAQSPADHVVMSVGYHASGATADEARRAAATVEASLLAVAREFGAVRHEDYIFGVAPAGGTLNVQEMTITSRNASPTTLFRASGTLPLRLDGVGRFAELRRGLEGAGGSYVTGPINLLRDDREARRLARNDALARAREEADQFAAAQGLRVARLLRFSEAPGGATTPTMPPTGRSPSGQVETRLSAQVGFALAPR